MNYEDLVKTVIEENKAVLDKVNKAELDRLLTEIEKAKTIQLYAMGRMALSVRAFAMRLKHMALISMWYTILPHRLSAKEICSLIFAP